MPQRPAPAIDGFTYLRHLGSGGFSDVFLYHQHLPSRDVAIKVLRSITQGGREQFATEANLMAMVASHSAIASIFAADVDDDGDPYLVMEYCPGGSLGGVYRDHPLEVTRVLRLGIRLASALECAHQVGIVHRDIKPANLLITQYNTCVLADFGISTADIAGASQTNTDAGSDSDTEDDYRSHASLGLSLPWAAPEVLAQERDSDGRADQFSLAATLYTLAEGRSPRESAKGPNSSEHIRARISSGFIATMSTPGVPKSLEAALRQAMSFDPDSRFSSCLDFARALQRVQDELGQEMTATEVPGAALYPNEDDFPDADPTPAQVEPPAAAGMNAVTGPDAPRFGHFEETWIPDAQAQTKMPHGAEGTEQSEASPSAPTSSVSAADPPADPPTASVSSPEPTAGPESDFMIMAPDLPVPQSPPWREQIGRSGLILAVIFVVAATIGGSLGLIHLYRNPHYSGQVISHLQVEKTLAYAYSVQAPRGLKPPSDIQTRFLSEGSGEPLSQVHVATISLDHDGWPDDSSETLNPWILQSKGDELYIAVDTLREELHLDPDTPLRPGAVLLVAAPPAYFANRVPALHMSQTDQTLAIVVIIS